MVERPADRCPYLRPFPEDFHGCSAYRPGRFVALDTGYRPLPSVWTCGHLDSAAAPQRSRWYARCRIGDAAARERWVSSQRAERLAAIRALQDELNPVLADLVTALWSEKARQLRSDSGTADWREATAHLRDLGRRLLSILGRFFAERADRLQALGFPLDASLRFFDEMVERWIEQPTAAAPLIPDSALDPFPPDTRVFFKPDYVDASAG
jgi:hypothetical protein